MLTQFRGALKGVVAWFIIALLVLAFGLFGIPDLRNFAQSPALQVGGTNFSTVDIQREFDRQLDLRRQSGQPLTREEAINAGLVTEVLDTMKARAAVNEEADNLGLTSTNEMIADFLQSLEGLRNPATGQFDQVVLQNLLQRNNVTITEFREDVRTDLNRGQLFDSIASPMQAPAGFVEPSLLRLAESRTLEYVTLTAENTPFSTEPTEEELRTYYQSNTERYTDPEYRVFDLVLLSKENFQGELTVPEEDIQKLFELRKARLDVPETRTIVQIPYPSEGEALAAVARLETGVDVAELAQERSFTLDSVTYTDVAQSDIADAAVAAAVFEAEQGNVIGPITDLFGNHIVARVVSITEGQESTFEEQRDILVSELLDEETTRSLLDAIEIIETARDEGAVLTDALAEVEDATVQTFGPVDSNLITANGAIPNDLPVEALGEAFLLREGEESEILPLDSDLGYFAVSLQQVIPPSLQSFESVREDVARGWRATQQADLIAERQESISARLRGGETLSAIAESEALEVATLTVGLQEAAAIFPPEFLDEIYKANLNTSVAGNSADLQSAYVLNVIDAAFPPLAQAEFLSQIYQVNVGQVLTQELSEAYIGALQEDIGIKQNDTRIAQVFSSGQE
ncbi:MAG: SurA N-terminal domain-containing protein [Aquisalinus sp.]|nr:SurA N-terminal domain-containing protein [Aquisalinus sp.]